MKIHKSFILLLLIISLLGSIKWGMADLSNIVDNEYKIRIDEAADYTNHIDSNMLISVDSTKKVAYYVIDYSGSDETGYWVQGLKQVDIENAVNIGPLYHSGFNATSEGAKIASVDAFNMTIPSASNYSNFIDAIPAPFLYNATSVVQIVDGTSFPSALIGAPVEQFVNNPENWVSSLETYFEGYKNQVELSLGLDVSLIKDGRSLEYKISGQMSDIHEFTYHHHINTPLDYNIITVDGGFKISYDGDGALNSYSENYNIHYENNLILNYKYQISVGPGSWGNVKVGGKGILSFGNVSILLATLVLLVPISRNIKRK